MNVPMATSQESEPAPRRVSRRFLAGAALVIAAPCLGSALAAKLNGATLSRSAWIGEAGLGALMLLIMFVLLIADRWPSTKVDAGEAADGEGGNS